MSHVVHFDVSRNWFETNSRHQKRYSEAKKIVGVRGLLGRAVTGNGKYATGNMERATGNEERVHEIPKIGNLLACEFHLGS